MSSTDTPLQAPPNEAGWVEAAQSLMNDQCWCWGQDVLYPRGNLLIGYGLERIAQQGPNGRTAGYTCSINDHGGVWLRGSGVLYSPGSGAGILLGRFDMRPRVTTPDAPPLETWIAGGFTPFPFAAASERGSEAARLLVPEVCAWIADYEHWIMETVGVDHREHCLQRWPKRQTPAGEFERRWRALGRGYCSGASSYW
ncbi:MAG: hypothetical protein OXS47_06370 [Chloroflexota bacterium]|nr:hypothetical protein [Chloroflexota bacterium]